MKRLNILSLMLFCFPLLAAGAMNGGDSATSFRKLMEGNQRYVNDEPINAGSLDERRRELVASQSPFAVIVGCSDSRVPPEIIFDQNLGDIFVVRVAGNVVGPIELDSIEYAVAVLNAPLIMVLGHQKCGAVDAVLQGKAKESDLEGIAPLIQQAVDKAKRLPGDTLTNAIKENVKITIKTLEKNPELKAAMKNKKLKIVGGFYELETGKVQILQGL